MSMKGIRIRGKGLAAEYDGAESRYRIDYRFEELVFPITDLISDLYWVLADVVFNHVAVDGRTLDIRELDRDTLFIREPGDLRSANRGFLPKYAGFISGDWDDIYGLHQQIDFSESNLINRRFIEENVVVFFSCIDGAFWEVYSQDPDVLKCLQRKFPFNETCSLAEKKV